MENTIKPATAEVKRNNKRRNKKTTKPTTIVEVKEIKVSAEELPIVVNPVTETMLKVRNISFFEATVIKAQQLTERIKRWFKRK